jgi:hypothetical protein
MPTIVLTSGTQWFVPPDCQTATIEAIGAGVLGYTANHGGSYAKSTGVALTPGSYVNIGIPSGGAGGSAWLNAANQIRYSPSQVSWSGTQFVALDPTNNVITSPDCVTWTQKLGALTPLINRGSFIYVSAYNSTIVVVAIDLISVVTRTSYSPDGGTTWFAGDVLAGTAIIGLNVLNGTFLLTNIGGSTYRQYTSTDGLTWFQAQSYISGTGGTSTFIYGPGFNKSIFANSLYVSIGTGTISGTGNTSCISSSASVSGTQTLSQMVPGTNANFNGIAYGNGLWVAVWSDGACNDGRIFTATTPNGTWTERSSGTGNFLSSIVFDGTKFIINASSKVLTSTASSANPNATWTQYSTPFTSAAAFNTRLVVSGAETYACSTSEGIAKSADNGTTWTKILSGTGAPVVSTNGVTAAGGAISPTSQEAYSTFTAGAGNFYRGGTGGLGSTPCCGSYSHGGGGGGGGPNGAGGNGSRGYYGSGGGGGANGGSNAVNATNTPPFVSGAGGNNRFGTGGGAPVAFVDFSTDINGNPGTSGGGGSGGILGGDGGDGSLDIVWTDFTGATYGVGAGGSGASSGSSRNGVMGLAGGPGAAGRGTLGQGIIVITYTSAPVSGTYTQVLTSSQTVYVSPGTTTIVSEAIGPGSNGGNGGQNGGGGGAYSKSSAVTGFTLGGPAFANVPAASAYGSTANSWFNFVSNSQPISSSQGVLAMGASFASGGGAGSLGSVVSYNGGNGGNSQQATRQKGGGGGAAAGPLGVGFSGGNGRPSTASGGGGGGGGTSGSPATAGVIGGASNGGNGGQSSSGNAGGTGGTSTVAPGNGTNGSGGGGAGPAAPASGFGRGGNGSTLPVVAGSPAGQVAWTLGGVVYGPGSGGGGGGQGGTTTQTNFGGNAGPYGGGGGATGQFPSATTGGGLGGQGLVVVTYTVVAQPPIGQYSGRFFALF